MSHRILWIQSQQSFEAEPDESVLEAATRQGIAIPHECTFGGCGTCRIQVTEGTFAYPDHELPLSINEIEHAQGLAVACQARACSDLVISIETGPACSPPTRVTARIAKLAKHTDSIWDVELELPQDHGIAFAPGQYLNVLLPSGESRSFSMAGMPHHHRVALHIRTIEGGAFTSATLPRMHVGDTLEVELPHGAFYYRKRDDCPLIFAATGTGFAPIRAILESLLDSDDCPPIHFYWGMRTEADFYLLEELHAWSKRLYEFTFVPVLSRPSEGWSGRTGYVQDAIAHDFEDLSEHAVYLCGSPAMVDEAKAIVAMQGAEVRKIYSDSFTFQHSPATAAV